MKTDIEISREASLLPIKEIAHKIDLGEDDIEPWGRHKAKIDINVLHRNNLKKDSKLILVTSMTPTPAGEGKTTTTIGLAQALQKRGKQCTVTLREPSMGPCFGLKGGATGGGYSQVVPMEDINLHFTGDIHAIGAAHNLLAAIIDNNLTQGNRLGIDPRSVVWKRALDMNDRALRDIIVGLGGRVNGVPREDGFVITVASEIMAILCLSRDIFDLRERLSRIIVAEDNEGRPVTAGRLGVAGAMAALLRDALRPNLVQTVENVPAIVHGGPFANIAHGCNSVLATQMALGLSDYVVTEAGFATDLGAEKFFHIKCRLAGLNPVCSVIVASLRAIKYHGGVPLKELDLEDLAAVERGLDNLDKHMENIAYFGVPAVVALNRFNSDTDREISMVMDFCRSRNVKVALSEVWEKGGEGGLDLADTVLNSMGDGRINFLYNPEQPIKEKIEIIARKMYGAGTIRFTKKCEQGIRKIEERGLDRMPLCMAKTQNSLSDDPTLKGRPRDFELMVREVSASAGAGFIIAYTGDVLTMPGLPARPAAEHIDIDEEGRITGLS